MIGEGLDLPELKIAVLHSAPRSLPFTLQFVGRISRVTQMQVGDAHLIAIPDEVRGEMRKLYRSDVDWKKLVPKLADKVIGKIPPPIHVSSRFAFEDLDISPWDLKPFFSVRVYAVAPQDMDMTRSFDLPDGVGICFQEFVDQNLYAIITESESQPPWAKDTDIREARLDLHVFYYHDKARLLFEATTSDSIAKVIRLALAGEEAAYLPSEKIMRVMQSGQAGNYFMVGLRNAIGRGPAQPTYKTLMGGEVQAAVRPTDGKTFAPGHVLAQLSEDETRGIGTMKSRVWAIKRAHLGEFRNWCDQLVDEMGQTPVSAGLPQLSFLASYKPVKKLSERPLVALLDERLHSAIRRIVPTYVSHYDLAGSVTPYINIVDFANGVLDCEFCFDANLPGVPIQYSASAARLWERLDNRDLRIRLEFSDTDIFEGNLLEYLKEYAPSLVMPKGGVIIGQQHWLPSQLEVYLPPECLQPMNWQGCEITNEAGQAQPGQKNIRNCSRD